MTNARIERLTREAMGPRKTTSYTEHDDTVLRAVGVIVLVVTVIVFASWPRGEEGREAKQAYVDTPSSDNIVPATHRSATESRRVTNANYSPMY